MLPDDFNNSQHSLPNFFVLIPSHILDNERIDGETAILFGRIASLSDNRGCCWASDKYLAKLTRTSERNLRRRMKTLEDCGCIKIGDDGSCQINLHGGVE